ncbi:hypothetical protein HHI36_002703 [Cryptolaemus montrouzieri]|uniref:Zinc finger PHD-type domain-containing protein n=1 Tax=Cryptolaemus montrouzieri TaxID=559131 RepID=A0ABD2PBD7_9CUCU
MQNHTTITDQATAAPSSRPSSSSTESELLSVIDYVSNFLYEAAPREHLKTLENVCPPETEILLNLTPLSNLIMSSYENETETETFKKTKSQSRTVQKTKKQLKNIGKYKGKEKDDTGEGNADDAIDSDCIDDDDTIRLECTESYADSIPGEQWVQCITCKLWAHSKCKSGNLMFFECKHCTSDIED